jgi:hypothetical protein
MSAGCASYRWVVGIKIAICVGWRPGTVNQARTLGWLFDATPRRIVTPARGAIVAGSFGVELVAVGLVLAFPHGGQTEECDGVSERRRGGGEAERRGVEESRTTLWKMNEEG